MSRDVPVYNLGSVDDTLVSPGATQTFPRPRAGGLPRRPRTVGALDRTVNGAAEAVVRSLSIFAPGATQVLRGQITRGLFYASSLVFLASLAWALLETLDRLAVTLDALGRTVSFVFWILGALFALAVAVHLASVWTAMEDAPRGARHPVITGIASAIVPGWGQLLNGDRIRAMLCLGGLWVVAGVWLASSTMATELLNSYVPIVTSFEQSARVPVLLWTMKLTAPCVIWALAVYDAVASSVARH
jgi:TM2 domain-containing membrane protein YozV